ncbi:hypothetical protein BjapCC829_10830 [Bradyrhizobium barranii]|uniref:Cthe-2314-like HEPN domain-containing protein n=1 Tax=Bradyrhizobium barranii TaxID=2992140 RepID=A0ABY3QSV1_9BRAD|nr:hypothetical protein [Bradyrhizobium japonicum]UFW88957.1 hypothetical protein BjapCC829_10830 [Bradyrhizobium japonicum]
MAFLSPDQIKEIEKKIGTLLPKYNEMLLKLPFTPFQQEKAAEYFFHGFVRRMGTLVRCVDNVFALIPMDTERVPSKDVLHDAQINIQSFFANVYGCVDNLAWVWVYEKGLDKQIRRNRVGLRAKDTEVRSALSASFQDYLVRLDPWLDYIIEYRDALAHRIPLYVPPGGVPERHVEAYNSLERSIREALYVRGDPYEYERLLAEQNKLLVFHPLISHSVTETTARFAFHVQMVVDFLTVDEMGNKMLDELGLMR